MSKRYYWLKLKDDFFDNKKIKKLRSIAGGDTYVIIYLKMQLKSIKNDGILLFENVEETFADELALDIDEDVENVKVVINFLTNNDLLEEISDSEFLLAEAKANIGSEGASAERMRNLRERQKLLVSQSDDDMSQCDLPVTAELLLSDVEKEKEIEKEIEIEIRVRVREELDKYFPHFTHLQRNNIISLTEKYGLDLVSQCIEKVAYKCDIKDPYTYLVKVIEYSATTGFRLSTFNIYEG